MNIITYELDKELNQEELIKLVADLFVIHKITTSKYYEGMIKRQKEVSFYVGNHICIPHCVFEYCKEVKKPGIVVIRSKKLIKWDGNEVHYVIGIASKPEDHIEMLANIAITFETIEKVEKSMKKTLDEISDIIS